MMPRTAFQDEDYLKGNLCWVCGKDNPYGFHLKSYWDGEESVCTWQPKAHHTSAWQHVLYGGMIASLIDCHCGCTAIAAANRGNTSEADTPTYWYASVFLKVDFLQPTPVDKPVTLRARVTEFKERKAVVTCSVYSDGEECARGEVIAVRVLADSGPVK